MVAMLARAAVRRRYVFTHDHLHNGARKRRRDVIALVILLSSVLSSAAYAEPITFTFSVRVVDILFDPSTLEAMLGERIDVGQVLSGSFGYDSTTRIFGRFENPTVLLNVGGQRRQLAESGFFSIQRDVCCFGDPGPHDEFALLFQTGSPEDPESPLFHDVFFGLEGELGAFPPLSGLPTDILFDKLFTTPDFPLPTVPRFRYLGGVARTEALGGFEGKVTSITKVSQSAPVPEPATLALTGIGLATLTLRSKRRLWHRRY